MNNNYTFLGLFVLACLLLSNLGQAQSILNTNDRENEISAPFQQSMAPFFHSVASGDPLTDAVIIWTRVTPPTDQTVMVTWEMATDTGFTNIVKSDNIATDMSVDYTVKIDVTGLDTGTTYYYRFMALGGISPVGRTKTLQSTNVDHLKLAVVSCNNYQSGYFTAFKELSKRNDLDAVIHLGDFIYEYANGEYGYYGNEDRGHMPLNEILDISDYRNRYSHYRLDTDMQDALRQHPFMLIWDDHEVANDSWKDGAGNHDDATEGAYADRKAQAIQAYFEWSPVRENPEDQIYRSVDFGSLANLVLLDTRHLERSKQVDSFYDPERLNPDRTLLGPEQMTWFKNQLSTTPAKWKVVGNQVVFSQLIMEGIDSTVFPGAADLFIDVWNGYPTRRDTVIKFITDEAIDNVFFVTGDVHISLGFDVTQNSADTASYDPDTGFGSIAVECVTPSISSDNYDELDEIPNELIGLLGQVFAFQNQHNKYRDFVEHGYFVLDITEDKAQADYYYVGESVREPGGTESFAMGMYTQDGENYLQVTNTPAPPKAVQDDPAPDDCPVINGVTQVEKDLLLLSAYPNPTAEFVTINYALANKGKVKINLTDISGRLVKELRDEDLNRGNYILRFNMEDLPTGVYFVQFDTKNGSISRKVVKK